MTTTAWVILALLLVAQNFSFTVVGRARNSGSDAYHAIAAVFSNGIWIAVQFTLVAQFLAALKDGTPSAIVTLGLWYVVWTVIGSVLGGVVARRYFETGKRKVGHYDSTEQRFKQLERNLQRLVFDVRGMAKVLQDHAQVLTAQHRPRPRPYEPYGGRTTRRRGDEREDT